ncbi:GNAT family N-acetyltransferase [Aliiroseovarius subalbicans]|uniref:GNAT family N-acetyltransferase n=1 Tax=Aliiroseovarius subalbicans TaxID=2925840 RepID=UPI001F59BB20|nr:GNAT family N-acetyltransferase [Aliiroseovarius subalbicans]MCI2400691.1 GNAT family N-acetyltransferase [Aliiroseovarius subalbicans]
MKLPFAHIETARLVLRPPQMADWEAFRAFLASARSEHVGGPYDDKTAWRAMGHITGHWMLRDYGSYVLTLKGGDDAGFGMVGPWFPEGHPEPELAWSIWSAEHEGQGFAEEAAIATRDHAYGTLGLPSLVSYIDAPNARSITLAQRLGAVLDTAAPAPDQDEPPVHVYRHIAPDADGSPEAYA